MMSENLVTQSTKGEIRCLRQKLVGKGVGWGEVKELNLQELQELDSTLKTEYVQNPKDMLTKALASIQEKKQWHKLIDFASGMDFIARWDINTWDFESCSDEEEELLGQVLERIVEKRIEKLQDRRNRMEVRTSNRSLYLPQVTLIHEQTKDGTKRRWKFETDLISTGLLPRMLESLGEKIEGEPLSLRIVNNLPLLKDEDGRFTNMQEPIPAEEWEILRQHGWMPTQGNLAWNWRNKKLREVLLNVYPKVIDMGAYNHRLNAPLIPGGYFERVPVRFANPMAYSKEPVTNQETAQMLLSEIKGESLWFERDQECDGAGLYDPEHPLLADLVQRYGKVVFQITVLRPDGLFAKGIIVPREGLCSVEGYVHCDYCDDTGMIAQDPVTLDRRCTKCDGGQQRSLKWSEAIVLDMAQVKASWKTKVQEGQVEQDCFVGLMKAWDRTRYFPGSFEMLEMIKLPANPVERQEVESALRSLVEEAIENIAKDGIDGLMSEIARDDEQLKLIVKIIAQIRAYGHQLNPMGIPMVRAAIEDKLRAKLWVVAQGAGIRGRQYVTVLDATVPEGSCVLSGFKVGREVAIWRFPCVLPQGLVTCKVVDPAPHHMVDGKIVPNTVWLNPRDLTARMQGDDDGDIVGISSDPRILKLFSHRGSPRVYMIEPVGQKFDMATDKPEGHKYLETDPRGPVGLTTIWQAQLLACGDWWGGLALAVLNQEAIDAAKRKIAWTDIAKACEATMWERDERGNMVLKQEAKLDPTKYEDDPTQPSGWPGQYAKDWVGQRLQKFGCIRQGKIRMQPLAWRIQTEEKDGKVVTIGKRVNPTYMVKCAQKDRGFNGGNLVHWTHDTMIDIWRSKEDTWSQLLGPAELVGIRDLLFKLLEQKGQFVSPCCSSWEEYLVLRKAAGIVEYGSKFKQLLASGVEEEAKFSAIEGLNQQLHLTLKSMKPIELATIWYWELTDTWSINTGYGMEYVHQEPNEQAYKANKPNYAFRAIAFPGSPILPHLGIDDMEGCNWLLPDRGTQISQYMLKQSNPFQTLSTRAFANTLHGDQVRNELGRVEFHQCKSCMDYIQNLTVRGWRSSKTAGEKEFMKELIGELNKIDRPVMGCDQDFGYEIQ